MVENHGTECLRYFSELLKTCKSGTEHQPVFHLIVYRIARLYGCQTVAIVLINPKTEYLTIVNSYGLSNTFCSGFRRPLATGAIGELLWTGHPILITDSGEDPARAAEVRLEHPVGSCVCLQISVDHRTLGYLYADSSAKHAFGMNDLLPMQTFADIAGLAFFKSQLYEENLRLDRIDHETDLEKYAPFLERVRWVMKRAETSGEPFNLLLLDVDNLKNITKTYGYETSGELLRQLAGIVRSGHGHLQSVARYGFDEFIVMLEQSSIKEGIEYAETLRKRVEEAPFTKHNLKSTISIGISSYPQDALTVDDLLVTAKNAMFEAQRAGKNRVFFYPEEPRDSGSRPTTEGNELENQTSNVPHGG
jgi:diguanylate cyclase (GGDEF)-like protein